MTQLDQRIPRSSLFLVVIVAVTAFWTGFPTSSGPVPAADHHIHIPSEAAAEFINTQWDYSLEPKSADDVVGFLDDAGIEKGVLLSLGYIFGRPGVEVSNEYAAVRRENDFVARQAAEYPDRLVAFCSVNPLADYAIEEIERCARTSHLEGLKLQLANSKVSLRDSSDVRGLAEVFATANRLDLPIVIHLWTGSDYGSEDVEIFLQEVLPKAPDVPVQVAHMGGAGMFSETTASALKAFEEAIENDETLMKDVVFDLGAVTADPQQALAAGDTSRAEQYRKVRRQVAQWIERIGPDRVVFASDYFARSVPDYVETLRALPLSDRMTKTVFANRAPYLR